MSKNVLGLFILCFALQGCMSTVTRLWNNDGWEPPPEKSKAYDECFAEYRKIHPDPNKYIGSKEQQKYEGDMNQYTTGCLKRKGF